METSVASWPINAPTGTLLLTSASYACLNHLDSVIATDSIETYLSLSLFAGFLPVPTALPGGVSLQTSRIPRQSFRGFVVFSIGRCAVQGLAWSSAGSWRVHETRNGGLRSNRSLSPYFCLRISRKHMRGLMILPMDCID